jgi:hypothetical protein
MPWQDFLLREGCSRTDKGRFAYRTVLALVARQNGKSLLAAIRILGGMMVFGEKMVIAAAQARHVALETMRTVVELAEMGGLPIDRVVRNSGREEVQINGARYLIVATTMGGARGFSGVDLVVMDEVREHRRWEPYAAIDKTRRIRRDSQLWAISTEGDAESAVLNRLQEDAKDRIDRRDEDTPLGYFEWSAPKGAPSDSPYTWAMANPAMGHLLDVDVIRDEQRTDPAEVFETEVLNRKVRTLEQWVSIDDWDACADPHQRFPAESPFVFALHAGPELRHVSIIAAASENNRFHLEAVTSASGSGALEVAENRLESLLRRWRPRLCVVVAKSPVEALARRTAARLDKECHIVNQADFARACRMFYDAAKRHAFVHPGGPLIGSHLRATKRGSDGVVTDIHRVNSAVENDAAVACVLGVWGAANLPTEEVSPTWVAF